MTEEEFVEKATDIINNWHYGIEGYDVSGSKYHNRVGAILALARAAGAEITLNTFNPTTLSNGLYKINWREGGYSLAAVGRDREGKVWMAPTNWVSGATYNWDRVGTADALSPDALLDEEHKI